jgi:uncharacterized Ntn-hydrolase superfamily protein
MMKKLLLGLFLFFSFVVNAQHTFSIVAVDSITGEIGSAGATCGDSIIWPGTPGAKLISDVIPGIGAIHTQSYYLEANQINANSRMILGDTPQDIINWLVANDADFNSTIRQYGVVDYNAGHPRAAAFTGSNCFDYKNHIAGSNYSIQGNILLGQEILDSMESRFINTEGCLVEKLMAALQGANVVGADTRCSPYGTSSLSAFLRLAKPTDIANNLFIDLNVAATATGVEPIDVLQTRYNTWKSINNYNCNSSLNTNDLIFEKKITLYPNPCNNILHIQLFEQSNNDIKIVDLYGRIIYATKENNIISINTEKFESGTYIIKYGATQKKFFIVH